ncbi:LysR family transcriptional regulator [Streptomyces sp. SRF1]|uniref:helix-turn-helix domain-containing protein n=1 Tax=Streptomyces sp. SRF1 TaxID=1549642 RepID=UPI0025B119D5|nr:LysR family transcriptional regulator [Streptomyces sp. SRF1]MDN3059048.1 LysR family transcriptional regulator [Streptomyces sp. SRF1]
MFVVEEVETFLAIARSGNFAQAARIVHTSQSTVSYRLERLEKRLGRRLVLRARGAKGIGLTAAGQRYRDLAEQWERLVSEAARIRETPHAVLAVLHLYRIGHDIVEVPAAGRRGRRAAKTVKPVAAR